MSNQALVKRFENLEATHFDIKLNLAGTGIETLKLHE